MDKLIIPKRLCGKIVIPSSKSISHRMIIAAALAEGQSVIKNISLSKDIFATLSAMETLGAKIYYSDSQVIITGIKKLPEFVKIDCDESGSTLRFLMPIVAALGIKAEFIGKGRLPERPITPYLEELPKHGVSINYSGTMPFTVEGKLEAGTYCLSGDISSQFVTGLLIALTMVNGESEIVLTTKLESKPYVDITIECLRRFGGIVIETETGYKVVGRRLLSCDCFVEGDYSQAAFFEVANLLGNRVEIIGLNANSVQGDKKIVDICREMVRNSKGELQPFKLDCSDFPDLVPILAVLASFCKGKSEMYNLKRLRMKESDRLEAIAECLNSIGGRVEIQDDNLIIEGVDHFIGGKVDPCNDHRIAMAMAIASTKCLKPLMLKDAECVDKSYPGFWDEFKNISVRR